METTIEFVRKHEGSVLSCYDRVILKGYLPFTNDAAISTTAASLRPLDQEHCAHGAHNSQSKTLSGTRRSCRSREPPGQARRREGAMIAPDVGVLLNTLGVAQYRVGQFAESLKSLTRSNELSTKQFAQSLAGDVAFLAMVEHQLGHQDQATEWLNRLRELRKLPQWANQPEAKRCSKKPNPSCPRNRNRLTTRSRDSRFFVRRGPCSARVSRPRRAPDRRSPRTPSSLNPAIDCRHATEWTCANRKFCSASFAKLGDLRSNARRGRETRAEQGRSLTLNRRVY